MRRQRYEKGHNKSIGTHWEMEIKWQKNECSIRHHFKPVIKDLYQIFKRLTIRNVPQKIISNFVEHPYDPSLEEKIKALDEAGIVVKLVPKALMGIGGTASPLYEIEVSVDVAFNLLNQAKQRNAE